MKKTIISKQEYKTPIIDIEELEKKDILTLSGDNIQANYNTIKDGTANTNGSIGAPTDLFASMFDW